MVTHDLTHLTLGKPIAYVDQYQPGLLQPIARALSRQHLPQVDFIGQDVWTGYELSWLTPTGKPEVAIAEFAVPASSPFIIESKSFKYYLNSFNQTQFADAAAVNAVLIDDLSGVAGAPVEVRMYTLAEFASKRAAARSLGRPLDGLPLCLPDDQERDAGLLRVIDQPFDGVWYSHLLKSNCPVTGQPDWATVWLGWQGQALDPQSLLGYIVAYRKHQDFHENCVESIYCDLMELLQPRKLWVYARYTRRGGLDINPLRCSQPMAVPEVIGERQ